MFVGLSLSVPLFRILFYRCVLGVDLILCSGRTVTYFRDLQEFHSYVCEDRVLDIAAFGAPNNSRVRLLVLIANKGAVVLDGGQLVTRATIAAGPSRLAVPPSLHSSDIYAFYGAVDGSLGVIAYEEPQLSSKCIVEGRGLGSVVCLGWFYANGAAHLAVGRHDGSIQLYLIDLENLAEKPRLKFTYFCGEPVTSVSGGCVGTEENELVAATFSGRIFALRSRRLVSGATAMANIPQDALAARRTKLESEVARLEKQTANERDRYQRSTRSIKAGLSMPPLLDLQYDLSGATNEGWQETQITSAVPLDMLFVYCNRKLDMQTDSAAVLSICPSQGMASDLLATVRCQAGTRRLWIRMRYALVEKAVGRAESVMVLIYALPAGAPRVARLVTFRLPALPYYSQHKNVTNSNDETISSRYGWCQVKVSGSFSVAEMTSWLTEVLPGDLPRPAASVIFGRTHTLLGTSLICRYQRGSAVFESDNVSTVATIRDILSNCSVEKNIRVEITCDVSDDCCSKSLKKIEDQFKLEYKKSKDIKLKNALSALDIDSITMSEESPILCEDYRKAWGSLPNDTSESNFNELADIIEKWYVDWRDLSLRGGDLNNERMQLRDALRKCRTDKVMKIFSNEPSPMQENY